MIMHETIQVETRGRTSTDITERVNAVINKSGISEGICNVFILHTSASLILCENADPAVRNDMETFMKDLVRDGDPGFTHVTEGPDDMSAHIRTVLTDSSINIPVQKGRCSLGTWQGIFLWEHRFHAHRRNIVISIYGE